MHKYFEFLGLSQNAASVYLEGLARGPLTAAHLAELAGVKRVSVYGILDALMQEGLAQRNVEGKRAVFSMNTPVEIQTRMRERLKHAQRLLADFPKAMKNVAFDSLHSTSTYVQVYRGVREVKKKIQELARQKSPISWTGNLHALTRFIPEPQLFQLFSATRMKQPTSTRAITDSSIDALPRFRETVGSYRQFRFLPVKSSSIIACWEDMTGIFSASRTPTLILIRDEYTASLFRVLFDSLWELLPKI